VNAPSDPQSMPESERLARRWFGLVQSGSFDQLPELVHEDVVFVSKVKPGVIEGRDAFAAFVAEALSGRLHESGAEVFRPLDDDRIVVEGRLRWIDDERVIRDDPVMWALEFRDGLLVRFLPARTAIEAETLLRASG
jgi:hypothetical protein